MNILVTGANGFIGRNLIQSLRCIRDGKNPTRPNLHIGEIFEYTRDTDPSLLDAYCARADFVFNLAGVNRPEGNAEFARDNTGFVFELLETLKRHGNTCPVMQASSIQATLAGRYENSEYGKSKLAAEELLLDYAQRTGADVLIYRFPNVFGKWCRPNYNSVVATFCHNLARGLPIEVYSRETELELTYIDDLVEEMLDALEGKPHRSGKHHCTIPVTHTTTLGEIIDLLERFRRLPQALVMPQLPPNSLIKKLYSTYLSYLPEEAIRFPLQMHTDTRGSFTELLRTSCNGQFSVNIIKPGITKGQHWHNSKWELFVVVSGHGLIRERKIGSDEILEFEVHGEQMEAIHTLPGHTHDIANLSDTQNLVTFMWANETYDPDHPDTYFEKV